MPAAAMNVSSARERNRSVPTPERRPDAAERGSLREVKRRPKMHFFTPVQFMMLLLVLGLSGLILYCSMCAMMLGDQNSHLKDELSQLQSEATHLKTRQDRLMSLSAVEEKAKNELGMMKMSKNQVEYIALSNVDYVEIVENENQFQKIAGALKSRFSLVLEYLN